MKKVFRIIKNELSEEGKKAYHPLWYKIEQRRTILFFIHWWGAPEFEPPHLFENDCDAMKHIKEHYPNAIVVPDAILVLENHVVRLSKSLELEQKKAMEE